MAPLRIAFLWHFHQPYYRQGKRFRLPWVRLHGVKDYWTIPRWFAHYPEIAVTFNITPVLPQQLLEYQSGIRDTVFLLSAIPAAELTKEQKAEILQHFFLCNTERMILPYARYRQLYENRSAALQSFSAQDWRDLQVWYNLCWTAPLVREFPMIQELFQKGHDFTEEDKQALLEFHLEHLQRIIPEWQHLAQQPNVAFSVSPFYHPILPLLCDATVAKQSTPDLILPAHPFHYPEDAEAQLHRAIELYTSLFGSTPTGVWPPEGGVSSESVHLLHRLGFRWCATDMQILQRSLSTSDPLAHAFPYQLQSGDPPLVIFFRDHLLSDLIGFVYSRWDAKDAVADFLRRLRTIRSEMIATYGEHSLEEAVVSVILDGENCWEYYDNNGYDFIHRLCESLAEAEDLTTVLFDQIATESPIPRTLEHLAPGSWINADFRIWIGSPEDNAAWDLLHRTRQALMDRIATLSPTVQRQALEHLYIAEGSDWFWWYGEEHSSANDPAFDELFRWNLQRIYELIGAPAPEALSIPIETAAAHPTVVPPRQPIAPSITGKHRSAAEWDHAGFYDVPLTGGVMHTARDLFQRLRYGSDGQYLYLRCETAHPITAEESITLAFVAPHPFEILFSQSECVFHTPHPPLVIPAIAVAIDEVIECKIDLHLLLPEPQSPQPLLLHIFVKTPYGNFAYPEHGTLVLHL